MTTTDEYGDQVAEQIRESLNETLGFCREDFTGGPSGKQIAVLVPLIVGDGALEEGSCWLDDWPQESRNAGTVDDETLTMDQLQPVVLGDYKFPGQPVQRRMGPTINNLLQVVQTMQVARKPFKLRGWNDHL